MLMISGALIVGLTLGMLGSGGSILTVPILVYLLGHPGKAAIAESLAIVGGIALAGAIPYARSKQIDWRSVAFFGIPGMAGTWTGAWLAQFIPVAVQLSVFSVVMLAAAGMMLRPRKSDEAEDTLPTPPADARAVWLVIAQGVAVGVVTGIVGVGGGFLIVPALVLLCRLPMRMAVGSSLVIIALNSASGFVKYVSVLDTSSVAINWQTIAVFLVPGIIGSLVGKQLSARINPRHLRRTFAVVLVLMGLFILGNQTHVLRLPSHAQAARVNQPG